MAPRPKLKITLSTTDRILEGAGWLGLVFIWLIAIYGYVALPETIPVHFDAKGNPDAYGGKISLLFLPALTTALHILMTVLNRSPHIFNYPVKITEENALHQYTLATRFMRWMKLGIVLVFLIIMLSVYLSALNAKTDSGPWLVVFVLLATTIPMVIYLIKSTKKTKNQAKSPRRTTKTKIR